MEHRLAAILAADVVGYSRLVNHDEASTRTALRAHLTELIVLKIIEHHGRVVKTIGVGSWLNSRASPMPSNVAPLRRVAAERNDLVAEAESSFFGGTSDVGRVRHGLRPQATDEGTAWR